MADNEHTTTAHRPPRADRAERIARLRRGVAVIGNTVGILALVAALGSLAAILWFTSTDVSIGSVFPDDYSGTTTMAFPFLMALLSMIAFFFGQFASRGRWDTPETPTVMSAGSFRVDLSPISTGTHAVLFGVAVLVWALIVPLPVALEAAGIVEPSPGSSAAEQFWFTVVVYAVISAAVAAVVGISLLKKITFNARLARGRDTIVAGSPAQVAWRRFSHIWRGELMVAALAGAALGLAPLGFHLNSATYGLSFAAAGSLLLSVSVVLALNAWRSGLPVERVESYT